MTSSVIAPEAPEMTRDWLRSLEQTMPAEVVVADRGQEAYDILSAYDRYHQDTLEHIIERQLRDWLLHNDPKFENLIEFIMADIKQNLPLFYEFLQLYYDAKGIGAHR